MHWSLVLGLLVLMIVHQSYGTVEVFEFGLDVGRVEFTKSDEIRKGMTIKKNTKIPIVLPKCTKLTFVRVEVDNPAGPPAVSLDLTTEVVTITYRPLQYSKSSYIVIAKAIPDEGCRAMATMQ